MSTHVRIGLVGAGAIATAHVEALRTSSLVRIAAVHDSVPEAAGRLALAAGCEVVDDRRALLDRCDAVLLCTPPNTHAVLAREFLDAGMPVLCEKPVATSVADALGMLASARQAGVLFAMASKFRFVSDVIEARRMVRAGVLGEVLLLENIFASRVNMRLRWNSDPAVSGGGVLIDNGTHSVDLVRSMLGPVSEVAAVEAKRVQGLEVEDTARLFLRTADGASATCDLSWSVDKKRHDFLEVAGTEGTIQVGWRTSRYQLDSSGWVTFGHGYDKQEALRGTVENFAEAVVGRAELVMTPEDALASVLVIDAAYASLLHDNWVGVAEGPVPAFVVIHPTALVEDGVVIGPGTDVWDHAHLRSGAVVGSDCIIGEKTYLAPMVVVADRVKVNAVVYLCTGVTLAQGVMVGAHTVFTNDRAPCATTADLRHLRPSEADEHTLATAVAEGASIGAGSIIGPGITIGRFALVGMGSVVTRSVPDFGLVYGNPARVHGAVCRCGSTVGPWEDAGELGCPDCDRTYRLAAGVVTEIAP